MKELWGPSLNWIHVNLAGFYCNGFTAWQVADTIAIDPILTEYTDWLIDADLAKDSTRWWNNQNQNNTHSSSNNSIQNKRCLSYNQVTSRDCTLSSRYTRRCSQEVHWQSQSQGYRLPPQQDPCKTNYKTWNMLDLRLSLMLFDYCLTFWNIWFWLWNFNFVAPETQVICLLSFNCPL